MHAISQFSTDWLKKRSIPNMSRRMFQGERISVKSNTKAKQKACDHMTLSHDDLSGQEGVREFHRRISHYVMADWHWGWVHLSSRNTEPIVPGHNPGNTIRNIVVDQIGREIAEIRAGKWKIKLCTWRRTEVEVEEQRFNKWRLV